MPNQPAGKQPNPTPPAAAPRQPQKPAAAPARPLPPPVRLPDDLIGRRLQIASFVSLGVNLVVMYGGAAMANQQFPAPVQVSRIEIRSLDPVARVPEAKPVAAATPAPQAPKPEPKRVAQREPEPERPRERPQPRPEPVRRPRPVQVAQNTPREIPRERPVERPVETPPTPPPAEVRPPEDATVAENNTVPDRGTPEPQTARGEKRPDNSAVAASTAAPRLGTGAEAVTAPTLRRPNEALGTGALGGGPAGPAGRRNPTVAQGERQGDVTTPDAGQFTDPNSSIARATGAPALRAGQADGVASPGTGGPQARVADVSGSGGATIASSTISPARGPVGLPGAAAGPRNRIVVANERTALESVEGFQIQQGGGVRAGAPIARQGAVGGQIGTDTPAGSVAPRFAGTGSGAGTGVAGIAGPNYTASRGPITGGSGPIGPRGRAAVGYSGGDYRPLGTPGGAADGSAGGIVGGTGRPGAGAVARNTGFGGGPGSEGIGTRLGVRGGTAGAPAGSATSGTPGSGRGPIGTPGGAGGLGGPIGKRVALGGGSGGGGERLGAPGTPGDPGGVVGGTGERGGSDKVTRRGGGAGGQDQVSTKVGAREGTPGGSGSAAPTAKREDSGKETKTDAPKVETVGRQVKTQDIKVKRRVNPSIPEALQGESLKQTITATFRVRKNGSFSVSMTSSGNSEVDRAIKSQLERWQFEPAYEDGTPIDASYQVTITIKNG